VEKYIDNTKEKEAKRIAKDEPGDYIIRFLEPNKYKCIFCHKEIGIFNVEEKDFTPCCDVLQK
jgi:DNA-dependent RNA polymerase auxiliary subunit epsilon